MMKRLFILSVIVASAGSLLASCGKEPDVVKVPVASDVPIVFRPQADTKGADQLISLERLKAQTFSVNAWYTPEGETFGTGSIHYISNHRFGTLDAGPVYDASTLWQGITDARDATDPVYYPLDGTLTYFCYAPYRADVDPAGSSDIKILPEPSNTITDRLTNYLEGSPLICFTPSASPSSQIDFIASNPLLDVSRSSGSIPLDFTRHMTTNVEFWFKYAGTMDEETEGVMISQIIIRDVIGSEYLYFTEADGSLGFAWCDNVSPVDGSSSMPTASYTLSSSTYDLITDSSFLSNITPTHVNNTINGRLYLLPQTLGAGAQLEITYVVKNRNTGSNLDENVVICSLGGTVAWPLGKTMRYTITIGVPDRQIVAIETAITPWTDAGNTHYPEQELMY